MLECAGNGRGLLSRRTPGNQFGLGLFGQARWLGIRFSALAEACGFMDGWTCAVVHAPDAGVVQPEGIQASFAKGLPYQKAIDPFTILAWKINGANIPNEHGGPLRLVVPGWYGIWWVKWVSRIELTTDVYHGFWQNQRYTYQDNDGRVLELVSELLPRTVITTPSDGQSLQEPIVLKGLAWSGEGSVTSVEITVDDGQNWQLARTSEGIGPWAWVNWEAELPPGLSRGLRRLGARAHDARSRTQDWEPQFNRLGYGNNGIHRITIDLQASKPT